MPNLYRCENNKLTDNKNNLKNKKDGCKKNPSHGKKQLNFKICKNNTINSLNEVECFLRNFKNFTKYIKLYKILK